jgi:hypothetical protein
LNVLGYLDGWRGLLATGFVALGLFQLAGLDLSEFSGHPAMKLSNEVAALSELKKYSTAQALMGAETGRFARRISELQQYGGFEGIVDDALLQAWHDSDSPVPLHGYLYADVEEDEWGGRLRDPMRCGFSAFPAEPGVSGDRVFLVLMDETVEPVDPGPVSHGNWRLFEAKVEDVSGPVTRWPTETELETKFAERTRTLPRRPRRWN